MQEDNTNNNDNVAPYRASKNLNTSIGIPSMDVNDPMNMNIQSVNTNSSLNTNNINNANINNSYIQNVPNNTNMSNGNVQSMPNNINMSNNNIQNNTEVVSNTTVKRNFVSNSKGKKKNSINLGPEFKIALLIIVVLLVFIFLLPVITSFIGD